MCIVVVIELQQEAFESLRNTERANVFLWIFLFCVVSHGFRGVVDGAGRLPQSVSESH